MCFWDPKELLNLLVHFYKMIYYDFIDILLSICFVICGEISKYVSYSFAPRTGMRNDIFLVYINIDILLIIMIIGYFEQFCLERHRFVV